MVPSAFMVLESLPLTPNGKIDRRALPIPDSSGRPDASPRLVPPTSATERALAAIWAALLRVPEVSATDNFFELGGHSLLATQLASRVRSTLGVDLPLRQYFATPTLGALASLIDQSSRSNKAAVQAIARVPRELYRVRVDHAGQFVLPATVTIALREADGQRSVAVAPPAHATDGEPVHPTELDLYVTSSAAGGGSSLADV
jgi:hypothetical protein